MNNKTETTKETIDQMSKNRKFRTTMTKESHYWFFHFYFAHYITSPTADFQRDIIKLTEDESIKNLFIVAFRGSGKSTIVTTSYPLWSILGKQQKKFILILGQTHVQAKQHMMNLRRELESNILLRNDLGPFKEVKDEWGSTSLVFSNYNARITIASTEQSIRGLRHGPHRPDLIIGDDIEDLNSTKTREGRNKTYNWLTSEVIPAGNTSTRLIVVGNLLHEDSLLMRIRELIVDKKMDGIFKFIPLLDKEDNIMWPGKYPTMDDIEKEKRKTGNDRAWQREYLLKIIPAEDQVIYNDWIHYYDELPSKEEERYHYTWAGVDLAISEKSTADYTAIVSAQVHGNRRKRKIYILPNPINKRINFPDLVILCRDHIRNVLDNGKLIIEKVGYQESLAQLLHKEGYHVEAAPISGDKRSRLSMTSSLIQNGTIMFPKKGAEALIQQLTGFGVEKHDDLVDAFTILINKLVKEDNKPRPQMWFINDDDEMVDLIKYDDEWDD